MEIYVKNSKDCILELVRSSFPSEGAGDPTQLGPLVLAYIGDTVYDLYIRTHLILTTGLTAHGLHLAAAKRVNAVSQAESFHIIEPFLTEEEMAVFRRGRNGHIGTVPKNASVMDYRVATGLEAVLGWLYLKGEDGRLSELMGRIINQRS